MHRSQNIQRSHPGNSRSLFLAGCERLFAEQCNADRSSVADLAPDEKDRVYIEDRLAQLRETQKIVIPFPGDEKSSGGCLAAGRGFPHQSDGRGTVSVFPFIRTTSLANIS